MLMLTGELLTFVYQYREFIIESYGWYLKTENLLCIAMEYCNLGDLARYLESNGRLTEKDANIITTQLLAGLNFMHDEGWAHRDLKLSVSESFFTAMEC